MNDLDSIPVETNGRNVRLPAESIKAVKEKAKILIERWRKEFIIRFGLHSALGYLPPLPETIEAVQTVETVCITPEL